MIRVVVVGAGMNPLWCGKFSRSWNSGWVAYMKEGGSQKGAIADVIACMSVERFKTWK